MPAPCKGKRIVEQIVVTPGDRKVRVLLEFRQRERVICAMSSSPDIASQSVSRARGRKEFESLEFTTMQWGARAEVVQPIRVVTPRETLILSKDTLTNFIPVTTWNLKTQEESEKGVLRNTVFSPRLYLI